MSVVQNWTKVLVSTDERGPLSTAGLYPTRILAEKAGHTGWYGSPPHFESCLVTKIDGQWYELKKFTPKEIKLKETASLKELEDELVAIGAARYYTVGRDTRFLGERVMVGAGAGNTFYLYVVDFPMKEIKDRFGHLKNVQISKSGRVVAGSAK